LLACEGWGIQAWAWLAGEQGQRLISAVASIALTFTFAVLAWEAASSAIQRYMAVVSSGEPTGVISARGRTLLPLLQKTLLAFLSVMVVLVSLSELGVNIAPLLAGAGVAGLAIGFGAQRLVQDVITGFFMLVEDAVAVGDVVAVAGVSGVVEDMSVRALKLRDTAGALHTVPFSTVSTVTNMTKNFSYYVLDIAVAYHEDPDQVGDVCRTILDEMRREPAFARSILERLDVFGLDSFGQSAIVIKARIKTVPGKQWFVGREFNRRMKQRFEALGIDFPIPNQPVHLGTGREAAAVASAPAQKKEAAP
jgi:small conductance mechanosensitive channel